MPQLDGYMPQYAQPQPVISQQFAPQRGGGGGGLDSLAMSGTMQALMGLAGQFKMEGMREKFLSGENEKNRENDLAVERLRGTNAQDLEKLRDELLTKFQKEMTKEAATRRFNSNVETQVANLGDTVLGSDFGEFMKANSDINAAQQSAITLSTTLSVAEAMGLSNEQTLEGIEKLRSSYAVQKQDLDAARDIAKGWGGTLAFQLKQVADKNPKGDPFDNLVEAVNGINLGTGNGVKSAMLDLVNAARNSTGGEALNKLAAFSTVGPDKGGYGGSSVVAATDAMKLALDQIRADTTQGATGSEAMTKVRSMFEGPLTGAMSTGFTSDSYSEARQIQHLYDDATGLLTPGAKGFAGMVNPEKAHQLLSTATTAAYGSAEGAYAGLASGGVNSGVARNFLNIVRPLDQQTATRSMIIGRAIRESHAKELLNYATSQNLGGFDPSMQKDGTIYNVDLKRQISKLEEYVKNGNFMDPISYSEATLPIEDIMPPETKASMDNIARQNADTQLQKMGYPPTQTLLQQTLGELSQASTEAGLGMPKTPTTMPSDSQMAGPVGPPAPKPLSPQEQRHADTNAAVNRFATQAEQLSREERSVGYQNRVAHLNYSKDVRAAYLKAYAKAFGDPDVLAGTKAVDANSLLNEMNFPTPVNYGANVQAGLDRAAGAAGQQFSQPLANVNPSTMPQNAPPGSLANMTPQYKPPQAAKQPTPMPVSPIAPPVQPGPVDARTQALMGTPKSPTTQPGSI